jgi:hypothetical protein
LTELPPYATGIVVFLFCWGLLFWLTPFTRKAQLLAGLGWAHTAPLLQYWHAKDYWRPAYFVQLRFGDWVFGIEDYLFGFLFAGFSTGLFLVVLRGLKPALIVQTNARHLLHLVALSILMLSVTGAVIEATPLNSLWSVVLVSVLTSGFVLYRKKAWQLSAIFSAVLVGLLAWSSYWGFFLRLFPKIIDRWWLPSGVTGIDIFGVPVEEIIWGAAGALFVAPLSLYVLSSRGGPGARKRGQPHSGFSD